MRVAILPTGRMELRGVPRALEALFPDHEFYAISKRPGDAEPFDSFTSSGWPLTLTQANPNLVEIVERMTAELAPGRNSVPPDLLFVLDDLELPNLLATPMIEAWLFADPDGPGNAGVPTERLPPDWERTGDPEAFLTRDPAYLADDCSACTAWRALSPAKQKRHTPVWRSDERASHPKAFLAWLCRDPAEKTCTRYRETHEGANALAALSWDEALRIPEHCTYLRALVEDLADGLGETLALPAGGAVSPHTSHRAPRSSPVLRNIRTSRVAQAATMSCGEDRASRSSRAVA